MFLRLLFLFTAVPLIELLLLIEIGRHVGTLPTVLLVVSTGFLGAWLARQQGLQTFVQVQRAMSEGRLPTEALLDGVLILIAGAVLLTPGLLTDLCGFTLLTPIGRRAIRARLVRWFQKRVRRVSTPARPSTEDPSRVVIIEPVESTAGETESPDADFSDQASIAPGKGRPDPD